MPHTAMQVCQCNSEYFCCLQAKVRQMQFCNFPLVCGWKTRRRTRKHKDLSGCWGELVSTVWSGRWEGTNRSAVSLAEGNWGTNFPKQSKMVKATLWPFQSTGKQSSSSMDCHVATGKPGKFRSLSPMQHTRRLHQVQTAGPEGVWLPSPSQPPT